MEEEGEKDGCIGSCMEIFIKVMNQFEEPGKRRSGCRIQEERKPRVRMFICGRQLSSTSEATLTDTQSKAGNSGTRPMGAAPEHCGPATRGHYSRKTESRRYHRRRLRVGARETVIGPAPKKELRVTGRHLHHTNRQKGCKPQLFYTQQYLHVDISHYTGAAQAVFFILAAYTIMFLANVPFFNF